MSDLINRQAAITAICEDGTWNNSPGFPAVTEDGFCNMAERRTDADE